MLKRLALLSLVVFSVAGCMQPMVRYRLAPVSGTREERTATLARAFVAAALNTEVTVVPRSP